MEYPEHLQLQNISIKNYSMVYALLFYLCIFNKLFEPIVTAIFCTILLADSFSPMIMIFNTLGVDSML